MHLPLLSRLRVPFLSTLHGRLDLPGLATLVRSFPNTPFVSISESQRMPLLEANCKHSASGPTQAAARATALEQLQLLLIEATAILGVQAGAGDDQDHT